MSVFAFTPLRFAALLAISVGVSTIPTNRAQALKPPTDFESSIPFLAVAPVGEGNGSLTSNLYVPADYTPMTQIRTADRHGIVTMPQGPPIMHHIYPPVAR